MARVGCGWGRGGRGPGPNVPSQMYHRKITTALINIIYDLRRPLQSFLRMGLGWVDMGSLGLGPSLRKQLVDRGHKDTGEGLQSPPSQHIGLPPKKWQYRRLSPPCCPWLTSAAPDVPPLHPAPTLITSGGEAQAGIFASCPWAPAQLASPCPHARITCPSFSSLPQSLEVSDCASGGLFPWRGTPPCTCPLGHPPAFPSPADRRGRPKTQSEEQDGGACVNAGAAGCPGRVW